MTTSVTWRWKFRRTMRQGGRLCSVLLFLLPSCTFSKGPEHAANLEREEIHRLLEEQAAAWNDGDLIRFMDSYLNSPELTFTTGDTLLRGWNATLERYRQRYQSGGAEMGELRFDEVETSVTGPNDAWLRGRYHLQFSDGLTGQGRFTLVLRKLDGEWKIVHDHTSSAN